MATITYNDPTLLTNIGFYSPELTSMSSTHIVITDDSTGFYMDIGGVGLGYNERTDTLFGTVTSLVYGVHGQAGLSIAGLNLPLQSFGDLTDVDSLFDGPDAVFGSATNDTLTGWAGDDTIIALDGNDSVTGDIGNDDVNGNVGMDRVYGGAGNDSVRGGKDNDTVFGDAGNDPHVNGNIGDDIVYGGDGNDMVYGGQGQDTVYGDAGADTVAGDLGYDLLYGGLGADRFVLRAGSQTDWVGDFSAAQGDKIMLVPGTAYTVINSGGQVMIDIGHGDQLGLAGVAFGSFSADWIVFG